MTLVSDVIAKTRNDYLMTGARDQRNTLAANVNTSDTGLSFNYSLDSIAIGARLSAGLEDMYVYATTEGSKAATVSRGDFGTTAAAHSAGDVVLVNPRFSDAQILRAVNDELGALSSPANGLFRVAHADLTGNASLQGYDFAGVSDVIAVIDVRYQELGNTQDWPTVPHDLWRHGRDLDTAVFASGQAIFVQGYVAPGRPIRVDYKAPFAALSAATDNVLSVSGLHVEAHDILALGAAIRLTAGLEIRRDRIDTQGDTRRASEVPAGANLGANRGVMQQYARRVGEEKSRLQSMYPVRLS